jgi:phosphoglycolate phosphatase
MNSTKKPDSLIFDLDGTLWDALDTYVESWNTGFERLSISKRVARNDISHMMGWEGKKVLDNVLPEYDEEAQNRIYSTINEIRQALIKRKGGRLYDGVKEGLELLSTKYPLFIVSNCPKGLIQTFINWAGVSSCIKDQMEYGMNGNPKYKNIQFLINKHNLKNAVYVGDTDGDREQSQLANIPFVFLTFGFGKTDHYSLKFDDFASFTKYYLSLK